MKSNSFPLALLLISGLAVGGANAATVPPPPSGQWAWWGGTGNLIDHTLAVTVDLTGTTNPTLSFATYYDIEDYWDFGFVQISTDGGVTVTSLPVLGTTTVHDSLALPAIVSNLPGFTDSTGGSWLAKSYDLSLYAGQAVVLQFRYMTDWATLFDGFFIDDISVTDGATTLFSDDVETLNPAWAVNGWSRVSIPEPTTLALFGLGLAGIPLVRRRRTPA